MRWSAMKQIESNVATGNDESSDAPLWAIDGWIPIKYIESSEMSYDSLKWWKTDANLNFCRPTVYNNQSNDKARVLCGSVVSIAFDRKM